jgi:hypothetical protein
MTPEKIAAVLDGYARQLHARGVQPARTGTERAFKDLTDEELLSHALFLCESAKSFVNDPDHLGKANRHLAATQMILSFAGWFTLAELMAHNRPA